MKTLLLQQIIATLIIQSLGRDSLRVVSHKHISKVLAIVYSFLGFLASVITREGLYNSLKARFMEVGKGKPLPVVKPNFVGSGW